MKRVACLAVWIGACAGAQAQTAVTVIHDNDEWAGTDEEYTEGSRLAVVSADWGKAGWAQWAADVLPGIEPGEGLSAGFGLGHYLYVPRRVELSAPLPAERAYAGWLHGSALLASERGERLDSWKFDVGVVGPSAGGEDLVTFFHSAFSGREMNGWDNQITDRLGVQAAWERRWRNVSELGPLEVDVSPVVGAEAGTVSVGAGGGVTVRVGANLRDDFGPLRGSGLGGSVGKGGDGFSAYAFASASARYSAWDLFVDEAGGEEGDPVRGGSLVEREPWRTETSLGVVVAWGGARATFAWTEESKRHDLQAGSHRFGEVSLGLRF